MKKLLATLLVVCCFLSEMAFCSPSTEAAAAILPTASDNLAIGLKSTSSLVPTEDGYMRVFYDGEKIGIEYYDDEFAIKSNRFLAMELDIWGGFYAGSDAYYLVEGQTNTAEDDTAEVIRVLQYDTDWNKTGTASITGNPSLFGGEVRFPFDYGCVEMTEQDGTLYIVTGHEGYVDPMYGQGHQGFLMIAVEEATMRGEIVACDLWHSFAQYIETDGNDLYVLEQSEGSRYTKLSKYDPANLQKTAVPVLEYGGIATSAWAISCYASVDGMALSSDHVLCLGTSIDQSQYDSVSSDTAHNLYLTVTPMSDFSAEATTVKWLTQYNGGGKCFLGAKITKVHEDRFMVSWEEYGTGQTAARDDTLSGSILHYMFINGKGEVVSPEYTAAAPLSDCRPIVKDSKIVYYASNANMVNFYSIDAETGQFRREAAYRVAGENATWELQGDVLTISGTGAVSMDMETHFRYPVSSTQGVFGYSGGDNAWDAIQEHVKTIVISRGITDLSERAFAGLNHLEEVMIASGVKSIGKQAFYGCPSLRKITIPSSVTSIGDDILWTGSYWMSDDSHVVYATIYAPSGSEAIHYAQRENIGFVELDASYEEPHTHFYAADWLADDERHWHACDCGKRQDAAAHAFEWMTDREPTETEPGVKHEACSVCGTTRYEGTDIPPLNHVHQMTHVPAKEAANGAAGNIEYWYCEGCENYFSDADGLYEIMQNATIRLLGDVNSDGKVNTTDARVILQYAAGLIGDDALKLTAADVDGNGKVNTTDARLILQYAAKIIPAFPEKPQA